MKVVARALVTSAVLALAGSAAAQTVAKPPQGTAAQMQARQQIAPFAAVLENAIRRGAQMLDQRLQAGGSSTAASAKRR